eukprot:1139180-Pelagomonas_calceolata.AAC.7
MIRKHQLGAVGDKEWGFGGEKAGFTPQLIWQGVPSWGAQGVGPESRQTPAKMRSSRRHPLACLTSNEMGTSPGA